MTTEQYEFPDAQRREQILDRAPFLKTYLDMGSALYDPTWQERFDEERQKAIDEIEKDIGKKWVSQAVVHGNIPNSDTLNPDLPASVNIATIQDSILFGYRAKSPEDIDLMLPEIISGFDMDNRLNPEIKPVFVEKYIRALMMAGARINQKALTPGESQEST